MARTVAAARPVRAAGQAAVADLAPEYLGSILGFELVPWKIFRVICYISVSIYKF